MQLIKNNSGLTLIETIVSLVILIIIITTFSGAVLVSLKSETTATNLDFASSMSASIFDYLSDSNNLKVIVENEIDMSSDEYENTIGNFIKEDLNDDNYKLLKEDFLAIYNNYTDNNRFDYLDKSRIIINKLKRIENLYDSYPLYEVELKIFWDSEQGEGKHEISTWIGVDSNEKQ